MQNNHQNITINYPQSFTGKTCSPLLCYRFVSTTLATQIPSGNAIANSQGLLHAETGFSYFGARYYDSDILTGWLSVDPLADKYPSLSPYAYCAWNPVKLVDPDGEEIWKPDADGNLIAEKGDNAVTLAKFMGSSVSESESLLKTQGYSTNVPEGSKVILDNVYTRNLSAHRNLNPKDKRFDYNCWGSAVAGSQGIEIEVGVGINCPIQFDNILETNYNDISVSEASFGKTIIRFAEENPYQKFLPNSNCFSQGNPNEISTASHGAIYYGSSQDGTIYVYSKNGWNLPPQIMELEQVIKIYGNVQGIGNDSGFYQLKE